ncbi:MAG: DUF2497 domain-containing protein [Proteobacteria bacterium]|nr:DUF2497 domain-containing protein [Pseudomonadota bacterium]
MSEGNGISNRSGPASAAEPSMEEILASIRRILLEEEGRGTTMPDDEEELLLDASMLVPGQDLPAASSATEPPLPETESYFAPSSPVPVEHFASEPPAMESTVPPVDYPVEHFASEPPAMESTVPPVDYPVEHFASEPPAMESTAPPVDFPAESIAAEPFFAFQPSPAPETVPFAEPLIETEPTEKEKENYMEEQVQGPDGLVGDQAVSEISNSIGALVRSVSSERSASIGRGGITIEDIVREEVKPVLKAWLDTHLPSLVERVVRAEINRVMDRAQG